MKNLIVSVIFIFSLFVFHEASSQEWALGARAGLSIPNLTGGGGNELSSGYKSAFGANAAIFAEFKFSKLFSLQPQIEYSAEGGVKNGYQAFPNPSAAQPMQPTYLYADFKNQSKIDYLLIPVLAKLGWNLGNSPWRFYFNAGPYLGFLLSAHQVVSNGGMIYVQNPQAPGGRIATGATLPSSTKDNDNIKDKLNSINYGFEANFGFAYRTGPHSIFVEGGGNYGLLKVQKSAANGQNNLGAGTVVFGYSHWFGNR